MLEHRKQTDFRQLCFTKEERDFSHPFLFSLKFKAVESSIGGGVLNKEVLEARESFHPLGV